MTLSYTPYIWPFIGTIIINFLMIFYVLRNWHRKGVIPFIIVLLFSSLWCLEIVMELITTDSASKFFWSKVGFPSYTFGPLSWFIMVMQVTDQNTWISVKKIFLLCIIPLISIFLVWTNELHGLVWQLDTNGAITMKHGPWFWVHAIYSDGLNLISVFLTFRFWKVKAPLFSIQFGSLAFSMIFVMIVNAMYVLRIGPIIDTTPIAWGISSLFILRVLFMNKMFDIVPIARNRVMESMTDGLVVLDIKNRIVDVNLKAQKIFKCENKIIGQNALKFFETWNDLLVLLINEEEYVEFKYISENGQNLFYEASCIPVKNEHENLLGKFIIIRDVTEKRIIEERLLEKQREIAIKEEREHIARDLHDNLGQILGFVNVQAQAINAYLKQNKLQPAVECLERLTEVAQEAHITVRKTIMLMCNEIELRKKSDFFNELDKQIGYLYSGYGILAEVDSRGIDNFSLYDSKAIAQASNIIKESLNNVVKHSKATFVKLKFEEDVNCLIIYIIDNGCGFSTENVIYNSSNKYGLLFMKKRAMEIGGYLDIHSEIGTGTTVKLQIPKQLIEDT